MDLTIYLAEHSKISYDCHNVRLLAQCCQKLKQIKNYFSKKTEKKTKEMFRLVDFTYLDIYLRMYIYLDSQT